MGNTRKDKVETEHENGERTDDKGPGHVDLMQHAADIQGHQEAICQNDDIWGET